MSVAGLDERLQWTSPAPGNIALAYASAAPVCAYLNGCDSSSEKRAQTAASCLLVAAQYLAALQHAAATARRGGVRRRVVLLPLGAGAFQNPRWHVALALLWAVGELSPAERAAVQPELLCYDRAPVERDAFEKLLR